MTHQQQKASSPSHWVPRVLSMAAGVTIMACSIYVMWWALEDWFGRVGRREAREKPYGTD